MYRANDTPDANGLRDAINVQHTPETNSIAITAFPAHLVDAKTYLLANRSEDDLVRLLFLP